MEERIPLKREKRTLRGNPEIDEGDEEDSGKNSRIEEERVDKERQPLFASVPSWLSPGGGGAFRGHWIAVRLRSDSVWTPSKSRVTASCKDKERSTRQRTSTSVRSRSVMVKSGGRRGEQRTSDCGPTSVGFGVVRHRKVGSLLASRSSLPTSLPRPSPKRVVDRVGRTNQKEAQTKTRKVGCFRGGW